MVAPAIHAYDQYTLLNVSEYNNIVHHSRLQVAKIIDALKTYRHLDADSQIAIIVDQLMDIPYIYKNGMGEGDWHPEAKEYRSGAVHVNQNPVYRLDKLNCQTFVQVVMALLHAKNMTQFDNNIVQISYGAAGNPHGEIVRYYNRNNLIDADFNPVNQRNGWLTDITSKGPLSSHAKKTYAHITRQNWFLKQQDDLDDNVQVLAKSSGPAMIKRFKTIYAELNFPRFKSEHIAISYLPKEIFVLNRMDGRMEPNQTLLDTIPTPAVAEIVRDVKRWNDNGINIKDIIGTEFTISHLGLLYRQGYNRGELIYRKTMCTYHDGNMKVCAVRPVTCQKDFCEELMFAHATNAYPKHYFWYQTSNNNYVCSPYPPKSDTPYTSCNRVVSMPFYDYLTEYHAGLYSNMELRSILGIHLEKISTPHA